MTPLISIIIPIYNVEAYLRECLNSVIEQTYQNWECIMVDDASTDGSAAIAREFCEVDRRFRLICHPINRGLSAARNSGLDVAHGELITFVDSDDYINRLMLESGVGFFNSPKVDIVCFGSGRSGKSEIRGAADVLKHILYQTGPVDGSAWGKIYAAHLFADLRFTEGITYEDLDIVDRVFIAARKVAVVHLAMYFYRHRAGSILHTWSSKRLDVLAVTKKLEARQTDEELRKAARDRRFAANFNMLLLMRRNGLGRSEDAAECRAQLRRLCREVMKNPYSRLKNRVGALVARIIYGSGR